MTRRVLATGFLLLALLAFGLAAATHAQFGSTEPLSVLVTPPYPRPYQNVTVVPQSSVINLSASTVTVTVNGTTVSEGSGAEAAYITMGGPGSVTTVVVRASQGAQTYSKTVTLRPADVALVVEPQSSAHPFYEGGTLVASEGRARIIALPDLRTSAGASIPAANLVYTWRNGEQILESASGIGKSVLSVTSPVRYRDARVTVTVTSQDRSVVAEAATVIAPADPLVRIYRHDPLLGPLFGNALPREIALGGTEETFRAVAYFFGEQPSYLWQVNGRPSDSDQDITVRTTGEGGGKALMSVFAQSPGSPQVTSSLSVTFGGGGSFNFFGL